jgi:hypothetical protein
MVSRRPAPKRTRGARYASRMDAEFTLAEARGLLAALRDLAPDGLRLPLSPEDVSAVLSGGVEIKSVEDGLLDFPTVIEGVPAYWCWRAGEDEIEWWHPRDTGFAGRRRVGD